MKILGIDTNAKTIKGQKKGYRTAITYLAPSDASGVINTCPSASKGCRAACLFTFWAWSNVARYGGANKQNKVLCFR